MLFFFSPGDACSCDVEPCRRVRKSVLRKRLLSAFEALRPGSNHLKLIDFGFSKAWDPEHNQKKMKMSCGTICYVAPEVIKQSYTHMCDLWSLGVVVFLLLVGYMPFPMRPDLDEMEMDILNGEYKYDAAKSGAQKDG